MHLQALRGGRRPQSSGGGVIIATTIAAHTSLTFAPHEGTLEKGIRP